MEAVMQAAMVQGPRQGYRLFDTAFGVCGIAWSADGLIRLQLPERGIGATEARLRKDDTAGPALPPPPIAASIAALQRYFRGEMLDLSGVPVDLTGVSSFFAEIYRRAREVGWGATATYGDLAQRAGSPGAARAVGQAMARNPVPIVIPCHRVLASGRKIGGFSAFGGTVTKERLLALEGVSLLADAPLLAALEEAPIKISADSRS
jgi:methylated-DNA-[protein]-cysteine S-methyltransferase